MTDGFKSRKFWLTVGVAAQSTLLLVVGYIDQDTWAQLTGAALVFFTAGNVGEKYAK